MKATSFPEILAPAGSLDKLKVAVLYGANAVYVGGQKFGLRTAAENFTLDELREGVAFAHARGAQVYVVLNSFLHDKDLVELPSFVEFLSEIKVDAVIVSDLGVVKTVRDLSIIPIHISTQASTLNVESAKLWKKMGATRIVLGREVSIKEAGKIKREAEIEIEMFIHGSMCMAYSGHCVISNFTQGRDSNRGGCAHSCRFEYSLDMGLSTMEKKKVFFMSSKDLEGIRLLPEFINEGIDSLKIEGRMKSNLYAGTMSKVYSEALNFYKEHGHFYSDSLLEWEAELNKVSHRAYTEAALVEKAGADSIFNERENVESEWQLVGTVVEASLKSGIIIEVRNAFNQGDKLEIVPFKGSAREVVAHEIMDLSMRPVQRTKPTTLVRLPYIEGIEAFNLVRQQVVSK
ncbi:MAG: U32 family peptidase [Bacteriovoracaceae bacterium]